MKLTKSILLAIGIILYCTMSYAQIGTMEAENGVILGNNTGTVEGTIRWTGEDLEGRVASQWHSLTKASRLDTLFDDDFDSGFILLEDTTDILDLFIDGALRYRFKTSEHGQPRMEFNSWNIFLGIDAGGMNRSLRNTAVGLWAFRSDTTGQGNTANGFLAFGDSQGSWNTAIGSQSLRQASYAFGSTVVGSFAQDSTNYSLDNVSMGTAAQAWGDTSEFCVALGRSAGGIDNVSKRNVYVGCRSATGDAGTLGSLTRENNVMLGFESGRYSDGSHNVFIGHESGRDQLGDHKLIIENTLGDSSEALIYGEFDNDILRFNASTSIYQNSDASSPQLFLGEIGNDGARIVMANDQNTNDWTIYGRPQTSAGASVINFYYDDNENGEAETGNKVQFFGDGDVHFEHSNNASSGGIQLKNSTADDNWRMYVSSSSGALRFYSDDASTPRAWIDDVDGAYNNASDLRVKKNIQLLSPVMSKLMLLQGKEYNYLSQKSSDERYLGFIAQEAQEIFPELVSYQEDDDMYGINYAGFSVVAIKAIQEQQVVINDLESKNDELQTTLMHLESQIRKQEKMIIDIMSKME